MLTIAGGIWLAVLIPVLVVAALGLLCIALDLLGALFGAALLALRDLRWVGLGLAAGLAALAAVEALDPAAMRGQGRPPTTVSLG